jgi:hypothetical protein
MTRLGEVHGHYVRHGTTPNRPFLVLGARPFRIHEGGSVRQFHGSVALGLIVKGADGREYDLGIDVLWDDARWTIQTQAWVESHANGQNLLRELPERTAEDLEKCIEQVGAAVGDLVGFDDLVPGSGGTA